MGTAGMARHAIRGCRRGLGVVEAKFKGRRAGIGGRSHNKPAEGEQETLRRDSVGENETDKRSPQALASHSTREHAATQRHPKDAEAQAESQCVCGWTRTPTKLSRSRRGVRSQFRVRHPKLYKLGNVSRIAKDFLKVPEGLDLTP